MTIEEIKKYIETNHIDSITNKWFICHQKFFLCDWLRNHTGLNLQQIADMVGYKAHDRVIHAIRKHNDYSSYNDKVYKENTRNLRTFLNGDAIEMNLKDEILKIESLIELHQLQNKLRRYDADIVKISRV